MSDTAMVIAFIVLSAAALWFFIKVFFGADSRRKVALSDLAALSEEASEIVDNLPTSVRVKNDLMEDVEVFSATSGGSADILRLMIRYLPTHYHHDIAGAALTLKVGVERGMETKLTVSDITGSHIVLHDVLERQYERDHVDLPKRQRRSVWKSYQKDICFAMDQLNEYPMLLPIIQERGVTDVYEALETAKVMAASDARALSSGML